MMQANRIQWADSMKAFSIMAVVLNHTQVRPEVQLLAYLLCLPGSLSVANTAPMPMMRLHDGNHYKECFTEATE